MVCIDDSKMKFRFSSPTSKKFKIFQVEKKTKLLFKRNDKTGIFS